MRFTQIPTAKNGSAFRAASARDPETGEFFAGQTRAGHHQRGKRGSTRGFKFRGRTASIFGRSFMYDTL